MQQSQKIEAKTFAFAPVSHRSSSFQQSDVVAMLSSHAFLWVFFCLIGIWFHFLVFLICWWKTKATHHYENLNQDNPGILDHTLKVVPLHCLERRHVHCKTKLSVAQHWIFLLKVCTYECFKPKANLLFGHTVYRHIHVWCKWENWPNLPGHLLLLLLFYTQDIMCLYHQLHCLLLLSAKCHPKVHWV